MPGWLAAGQRGGGTGGHRATAAEQAQAQALAVYEAKRGAVRARPAVYGRVLASLRSPGDMPPVVRRIFGASR